MSKRAYPGDTTHWKTLHIGLEAYRVAAFYKNGIEKDRIILQFMSDVADAVRGNCGQRSGGNDE